MLRLLCRAYNPNCLFAPRQAHLLANIADRFALVVINASIIQRVKGRLRLGWHFDQLVSHLGWRCRVRVKCTVIGCSVIGRIRNIMIVLGFGFCDSSVWNQQVLR